MIMVGFIFFMYKVKYGARLKQKYQRIRLGAPSMHHPYRRHLTKLQDAHAPRGALLKEFRVMVSATGFEPVTQ